MWGSDGISSRRTPVADADERNEDRRTPSDPRRRRILSWVSTLAMATGLVGGYGAFAVYSLKFLYPPSDNRKRWMFVGVLSRLRELDSIEYRLPNGAPVTIARQGSSGTVEDFMALSNVCPHLGCKVHWEANNNRFFCPCHNGIFDAQGNGIAGPPKGQSLKRFELRATDGILYIETRVEVSSRETPPRGTESRRRIARLPGPPVVDRPVRRRKA